MTSPEPDDPGPPIFRYPPRRMRTPSPDTYDDYEQVPSDPIHSRVEMRIQYDHESGHESEDEHVEAELEDELDIEPEIEFIERQEVEEQDDENNEFDNEGNEESISSATSSEVENNGGNERREEQDEKAQDGNNICNEKSLEDVLRENEDNLDESEANDTHEKQISVRLVTKRGASDSQFHANLSIMQEDEPNGKMQKLGGRLLNRSSRQESKDQLLVHPARTITTFENPLMDYKQVNSQNSENLLNHEEEIPTPQETFQSEVSDVKQSDDDGAL